MKLINQTLSVAVLAGVLCHTAIAQTPSEDDKFSTAICVLVTQGAYTAAVERQAGTTKQRTKAMLEKDLVAFEKSFSDKILYNP